MAPARPSRDKGRAARGQSVVGAPACEWKALTWRAGDVGPRGLCRARWGPQGLAPPPLSTPPPCDKPEA